MFRERAIQAGPNPNHLTGSDLRYYSSTGEDVTELRREQLRFGKVRREESNRNTWMAIPALAPVAVVAGLEMAAAAGARAAAAASEPLVLTERTPHLRVGDNWATRAGRRAHADLKARVGKKTDWTPEGRVYTEHGYVQPDVRGPLRSAYAKSPFQMEMKPNTLSGRRAAARAVRRYEQETDKKARAIYYDPKDYM